MLQKISKELFKNSQLISALRKNGFAAAAASDPIQKLFLDKIKEYTSKANSAPNGLVDCNEKTMKALEEELERIRNNFQIKKGEETVLSSKFNDNDVKYE